MKFDNHVITFSRMDNKIENEILIGNWNDN